MTPAVKITVSKENYLKAIADLETEGETVIAATLARWLNVSAPAVTAAIKRLKRDALINVSPTTGQISLANEGREIAHRLLYRHYLIERMLTEVFGMEWYKVHDEAEQLEHAVSGDFERKLIEKLGTNATCPHGNRVENDTPAVRRQRGWLTLSELPVNSQGTVTSVYERDRQLLIYLDELGVRPGAELKIEAKNYDDTLTIRLTDRPFQLGNSAAARIWIKPQPVA